MELFTIVVMTVFAIGLCMLLITSSQDSNLYSIRNLFMAVWLYYGFSVGIDLLSGAEIPYRPGEPYLMDPHTWGSVVFVMWNYLLCGATFLITYSCVSSHPPRPIDHRYHVRLPSNWFLIALHIVAAYVFVAIFFSMSRMERMAVANASTRYKFACLIVPLVLVIDILVIITANRNKGRLAWLLAVPLALLTGNRSYVLFAFLVATYRWRPSLRGWKVVAMATMCGVVVTLFKTVYGIGHDWWLGDRVSLAMIYDNMQVSLSGLDAAASYMIAVFYTQEPSPWWLGQSYTQIPLYLTWPRFLGGMDVVTLAESYVWTYHPNFAQRGGAMAFSAIAEAWLNFGHLGAIFLGMFWGSVARFFDNRPRGIAFYIVLLIIVRLFRSDFATLYKNWVLVWGAMFVVVLGMLIVYTAITEARSISKPPLGSRASIT